MGSFGENKCCKLCVYSHALDWASSDSVMSLSSQLSVCVVLDSKTIACDSLYLWHLGSCLLSDIPPGHLLPPPPLRKRENFNKRECKYKMWFRLSNCHWKIKCHRVVREKTANTKYMPWSQRYMSFWKMLSSVGGSSHDDVITSVVRRCISRPNVHSPATRISHVYLCILWTFFFEWLFCWLTIHDVSLSKFC